MRSTAGCLEVCTGLMAMSLFCMVVTESHACRVLDLVKMAEKEVNDSLHEYRKTYVSVEPSPKKFPQLQLESAPIRSKNITAVRGICYMEYVFESVLEHQKHLVSDKTPLITSLTYVHHMMSHVKGCLTHVLHTHCGKFDPNPEFPINRDHFSLKQWGLAALEHSQSFLKELLEFLEAKFAHLKQKS